MRQITKNSGFSLIELMVAVVVLGILVGYLIPNFSEYSRSRKVENALQQMISDLRLLRTVAVGQHHICQVMFDENPAFYRMWVDSNDDGDFTDDEIYLDRQLGDDYGVIFSHNAAINTSPLYRTTVDGMPALALGSPNTEWVDTIGFDFTGQANRSGTIFLSQSGSPRQLAVTIYIMGTINGWEYIGDRWYSR